MKKTSAKAVVKTAAPAPAAVKKTPISKKPAAAKAVAVVKPVKAPKVSKAPAIKPVKASPKAKAKPEVVVTTIVAAIDVGFGNHLTLRGEGPGLSWEAGVPLECVADDRWSITLPETSQPIICKFLLNDAAWCAGEDYTVLPGSSVVLSPTF